MGALRPAEQPRGRVGRHQRRLPGRRRCAVVKDWHLPSSRARKQQRWVKLTGTLAAGGLDTNMFALYNPPSPAGLGRQPGPARRGQRRDHRVNDPDVPTEVTIFEREPKDGGDVRATAVRARRPGRPFPTGKPCGVHRRPRPPTSRRDFPICPTRGRRHPAAPHPRTRQRRTAAPHRRHRRRHHGGAARPRLVVPGGARTARHRQDVHGSPGHRHAGERPRDGGSASSRNRTRWSRTCSARVIKAGVDPARVGKKLKSRTRRGRDVDRRRTTPRSSPTATAA